MTSLQSIIARIRALQAKTTEAGATEAEALAAAAKARELLERYQLDLTDLELRAEGTTTGESINDAISIGQALGKAVAQYCHCKSWNSGKDLSGTPTQQRRVKFHGLRSDVEFATWLHQTLILHLQGSLVEWMMEQDFTGLRKAQIEDLRDSFLIGGAKRIAERLRQGHSTPAHQSLVLRKAERADESFAALGLTLYPNSRLGWAGSSEAARSAGQQAGDRASFAKPTGFQPRAQLTQR